MKRQYFVYQKPKQMPNSLPMACGKMLMCGFVDVQMFERVNADADAEVKDARGSVRVRTLPVWLVRVRSRDVTVLIICIRIRMQEIRYSFVKVQKGLTVKVKKVKERILREIHLRTTGRHLSMGSHSVICHPTEVTAPPSPQPGRLVDDA